VLTFMLGVQCSIFQNCDKNMLATSHNQEAAGLHDYEISLYSVIFSTIRSVPNRFLISALLILVFTYKIWYLRGTSVQVFGITNFIG
jgi:hypothetical protein